MIGILLVTLSTVAFVRDASADIASTKTWSLGWSTGNFFDPDSGLYWVADNTSPSWLITDASSSKTWLLSVKGTTGDYNFLLMAAPNGSSGAPSGFWIGGAGLSRLTALRENVTNLFPANLSGYFVVLARRSSGGTAISSPTCHGVATSVLDTQALSFDNHGTTFYMATDQSSFDGVSNYVGKCNNGTWVNMQFGVGCTSCVYPHASSISVNGAGTVVTVQGNFQYGYTLTYPYQVMCDNWGLLYFHVTGATTGNWSNSP